MKHKLDCRIVQDILPLYVDGLTCEYTSEAIEEHMEECEACKLLFQRMKSPEEHVEQQLTEVDYLKKFSRHMKRMKEGIIGLLFTTLLILLGAYILWNRMIPKNFEEIRLDMELYEQYKVEAEVEADIVSFHVTYLGSEMKEFILSEEDCKMLLMLLENTDYYYVGSSKRENVVEGGIYLLSARDENDLWCYVFEVTDEGDVSTLNNKYNIKNNRAILEFLEKISQK